jgi:hypothetical protein
MYIAGLFFPTISRCIRGANDVHRLARSPSCTTRDIAYTPREWVGLFALLDFVCGLQRIAVSVAVLIPPRVWVNCTVGIVAIASLIDSILTLARSVFLVGVTVSVPVSQCCSTTLRGVAPIERAGLIVIAIRGSTWKAGVRGGLAALRAIAEVRVATIISRPARVLAGIRAAVLVVAVWSASFFAFFPVRGVNDSVSAIRRHAGPVAIAEVATRGAAIAIGALGQVAPGLAFVLGAGFRSIAGVLVCAIARHRAGERAITLTTIRLVRVAIVATLVEPAIDKSIAADGLHALFLRAEIVRRVRTFADRAVFERRTWKTIAGVASLLAVAHVTVVAVGDAAASSSSSAGAPSGSTGPRAP